MKKDREKQKRFIVLYKSGDNYSKAAFNSLDITNKQLTLNLVSRLSKLIKEILLQNLCPTVEQLLQEESLSELLLKLLSAMKKKLRLKELLEEGNLVLHVLVLHNRKKNINLC